MKKQVTNLMILTIFSSLLLTSCFYSDENAHQSPTLILTSLANVENSSNNQQNLSEQVNNQNQPRETTEPMNKLPLIFSFVGIALGLISFALAMITYLRLQQFLNYQKQKQDSRSKRNNNQQIQDLEDIVQSYQQQIETVNHRLYDLKNTVDTQALQLRQLQSQTGGSNLNPRADSGYATHNFNTSNLPRSSSENLPSQTPYSSPLPPPSEKVRLAQNYQENPTNLLQNATQVGMTKETTNKILGGVWEQIYLEENRRTGEYFIVTSNTGEMYLFLNPNSVFNPQTLSTINKSQLFICHGNLSQSRKGIDINIQKPATVKKQAQSWILVEPGEIILE